MKHPLQAWSFEAVDDRWEVVFARSEAGARAIAARHVGEDFKRTVVQRQEALDKHGTHTGIVNLSTAVLFEAGGWSVPCHHCDHTLDADMSECEYDCDDLDDPDVGRSCGGSAEFGAVVEGQHVYCSSRCRKDRQEYVDRVTHKKEEARLALLNRYPFVVPKLAWVGGCGDCQCHRKDPENVCLHFAIPGGGLTEKTREDYHHNNSFCLGCGRAWIARGDYEAFKLAQTAPCLVVEGKPEPEQA